MNISKQCQNIDNEVANPFKGMNKISSMYLYNHKSTPLFEPLHVVIMKLIHDNDVGASRLDFMSLMFCVDRVMFEA